MPKKTTVDISCLCKNVKAVRKKLLKESDVGGVLIATSFLDNCLESLLVTCFKKSKVTDKLLDPVSGTLGTFNSKINMLYCLGHICKTTYQDLKNLSEIRNIFAHKHLTANFMNTEVITKCYALKTPSIYLDGHKNESNYNDLQVYFNNAKNCFIYTVTCLSDSIIMTTLSSTPKNN